MLGGQLYLKEFFVAAENCLDAATKLLNLLAGKPGFPHPEAWHLCDAIALSLSLEVRRQICLGSPAVVSPLNTSSCFPHPEAMILRGLTKAREHQMCFEKEVKLATLHHVYQLLSDSNLRNQIGACL